MAQTAPDAEQLVENYAEIWNDAAYGMIPEVTAESVTVYDPGAPDGEVHGRDGLEAFLRELRTAFPDLHIAIEDILASDEVIMGEWTVTGTHEGEFNDIPPTDRERELTGMDKILVADGRVQEHRIYYDLHELFEQLGLTNE
ncbi:ester cyclase [Halomontanus rarus]|uniref:ester cyclase n=1 Tax=Halomontanus rarus TaxID=3034020 RepID=UPI0023E8D918|nr:ester cyclase [Halovivax sp. TS33]